MGKTLLIKIEPVILKYARRYSGYTIEVAARKAKMSADKLKDYEDQKSEIPLTHIERLANVYKRPIIFFLLQKVPSDAVEPKAFRIVYESGEVSFSPSVYLAIRRARYVQSTIAELSEKEFEYPFKNATIADNPGDIATFFRSFLKIDIEEQQKWVNPSASLRNWKNILEDKGIFVLQQSLPKKEVSAFCLIDKKPYIIVLNSAEHENRRIFSLFHEIGHIFLRQSGICTPDDLSRNSYQYTQTEKFCNQVAASFLLPKKDFLTDPDVVILLKRRINTWGNEDLKKIAQKFGVSREVVLRRIQTLGFINEQQYNLWRQEWIKNFEKIPIKKKGLRIPQSIKCISQNGRAFTAFVLNQYYANKITFSSAAEILNINPKHITSLEARF